MDERPLSMKWTALQALEQLDLVDEASSSRPVLIFKHSTTCSISRTALDRLERAWTAADDSHDHLFEVDLHNYRSVSNAIADHYAISHGSPQVLIIHNGRCVYDASHFGITYAATINALDP